MTSLGVSDVVLQEGVAWCQVRNEGGVLQVGGRLTRLQRSDGAVLDVDLLIEGIDLPTGPVTVLEAYQVARIRISGRGVHEVQAGMRLEAVRQWDFANDSRPGLPVDYEPWPTLDASAAPELYVVRDDELGRATTAFRLILVIPQAIVLYALNIAAEVIVVIGWFAALFTGRLPDFASEFLGNYLRWAARVYGYTALLTDEYPPFGFDVGYYPVHLQLPPPGRLNRLAVLFRIILIIPAFVLSTLVALGWGVASIVTWLIVLVKKRFPTPLFEATVAVLRYQLRFSAYVFLVTDRYPRGLFGDPSAATPSGVGFAPPPGQQPQPVGYPPGPPPPGYAQPVAPAGPAPVAAPPAAMGPPGSVSERGRLVLPGGAKRLVALFLVLGLLAGVGYGALIAVAATTTTKREAYVSLRDARFKLDHVASTFRKSVGTCPQQADPLACSTNADEHLAVAVDAFETTLEDTGHPGGTDDLFSNLSVKTREFATSLHTLAASTTEAEYVNRLRSTDLVARAQQFDAAYGDLVDVLTK